MKQDLGWDFVVKADELTLSAAQPPAERRLAFAAWRGAPSTWQSTCRNKLADLLGIGATASEHHSRAIAAGPVTTLRETEMGQVAIAALTMSVDSGLSLPAYCLGPLLGELKGAVMAIHGHGEAGPCLGLRDDYHHAFALRLAEAGYMVLLPELRGFGALKDLGAHRDGVRLDYWTWDGHMAYSLVTDSFLYGRTLIGDTVLDLLRWEAWLARERSIDRVDVAGISYGGDLALVYPAFSGRVRRIFASGTLGSFSVIFSRCYNAPAHCIPGVLRWMDRSDIAGLSAPRPIALHYGELDSPGPDNYSASYNETVPASLDELRAIYAAFGSPGNVHLFVTSGVGHEMDNDALLGFLSG